MVTKACFFANRNKTLLIIHILNDYWQKSSKYCSIYVDLNIIFCSALRYCYQKIENLCNDKSLQNYQNSCKNI